MSISSNTIDMIGNTNNDYSILQGVIFMLVIITILSIIVTIFTWKAFVRNNKPGWHALIPILNIVTMFQIVNMPIWWMLIPGLNAWAYTVAIVKLFISAKKNKKQDNTSISNPTLENETNNAEKSYIENNNVVPNNNFQNNQFINPITNEVSENTIVLSQLEQNIISNNNQINYSQNNVLENTPNSVENNNMVSNENNIQNNQFANSNINEDTIILSPIAQNTNQTNTINFCPKCGNKVQSGSNICLVCKSQLH